MTKPKPSKQDGNLTHGQKAEIVKYRTQNPRIPYTRIAQWAKVEFNLTDVPSNSTISRTINDREKFLNIAMEDRNIRRVRVIKSEILEEALVTWVLQMQHAKQSINYELIKAKGRKFAQSLGLENILQFSNGWISAFCKRNAFREFNIHGESGDVNMEGLEEKIAYLKLRTLEYRLCDIYNMDETALFYNLCPDKTIAREQIEGLKKVFL
jgi:hypothetical protein